MTTAQLQKQLRHLKPSVAPRAEWLAASRATLIARVASEAATTPRLNAGNRFRMFTWGAEAFFGSAGSFVMRSGVALATLALAVGLGGGSYVLAAVNGSVPGEALYKVKVAIEDVRLSAARTPQQRVALQVDYASRRLAEVSVLSNQKGGNVPQVAELVGRFESTVASAARESNSLDNNSEAASLARLVDDRLGEYVHTLEGTKQSGNKELAIQVGKAIAAVNRTETKTLEVIAKANPEDPTVATRIDAKIKSTELALLNIGGAKGGSADKAKENLAAAKARTAAGDYATAITLIREAEDLVLELNIPVVEEEPVDETIEPAPTPEETEASGKVEGAIDVQPTDSVVPDASVSLPNL